jgi:hypothetical protein
MRRDGWGKAQADYRIENGGSDASVFVFRGRDFILRSARAFAASNLDEKL